MRYARNSIEFLQERLCMSDEKIRFITYPMIGHEVTEDVLKDLARWIFDTLADTQG